MDELIPAVRQDTYERTRLGRVRVLYYGVVLIRREGFRDHLTWWSDVLCKGELDAYRDALAWVRDRPAVEEKKPGGHKIESFRQAV